MIIKSQRIKKALLTALADEEMLKIMNCIIDHSKSFNDIDHSKPIAIDRFLKLPTVPLIDKYHLTHRFTGCRSGFLPSSILSNAFSPSLKSHDCLL